MANKLKDTAPRPRIGKTAKDTRVARLIDINKVVDEVNDELFVIEGEQVIQDMRITALESSGGGGSEYTETIVNISSTQILAGGNIELLPAPGVGKYYEFDKIIIEATSSIPYTFSAGDWQIFLYNSDDLCTISRQILNADSGYIPISIFSTPFPDETLSGSLIHIVKDPNRVLGMYLGGTVTDGDGTLRVKIYHKTITFGA